MKFLPFLFLLLSLTFCTPSKNSVVKQTTESAIKTGAEQTEKYVPYLKGKRVAILAPFLFHLHL